MTPSERLADRYVCGFLFDLPGEMVVLIRKERPVWQRGKLNGVGGHIEEGEIEHVAMRREFQEETGLDVLTWDHFATLRGENEEVWFFRADGNVHAVSSVTDEHLHVVSVASILTGTSLHPVLSNIRWLLAMADSQSRHDWPYEIGEKGICSERRAHRRVARATVTTRETAERLAVG